MRQNSVWEIKMKDKELLTYLEEDYLKELINVSFGLAASIIGDMLSTKAELMIPKVGIYPIEKLHSVVENHVAKDHNTMLIKQFFQSSLNGDAYFMLSKDDASKLAKLLFKKETVNESEIECVAIEITNILTSACIGQMAQMSSARTIFLPPEIVMHEKLLSLGSEELKNFTQFMLVETKLNLESEGIEGQMLILIGEGVLGIILSGMPKI
jgi:chemotaxis protein CheC